MGKSAELHWSVSEDDQGERLDLWLAKKIIQSRSQIKGLINEARITVNGNLVKAGYKLKVGDQIHVSLPEPQPINIIPREIALDVVYEDNELIVINKPKGMVVHPAPGNWDYTLVHALLYHCQDLSGIGGKLRPGIVHRLDKDTTGLLVVAKNDGTHHHLASQMKKRQVKRWYLALVHGVIKEDTGSIDARIGRHHINRKKMAVNRSGREAITYFSVKERFNNFTLVECKLKTGRTHQIRVHLSSINHPIVGDQVYGAKKSVFGVTSQLLHAYYLGFEHPNSSHLEFSVEPPELFLKCLKILRNKS